MQTILVRGLLAGICALALAVPAQAGEVHVAVAANFVGPLTQLAKTFEQDSGNRVIFSPGSTGKLYAQIKNGAPFDVLLAADARRPQLLEQEKLGVAGSRFTYAVGRLALWSPKAGLVDPGGQVLKSGRFERLAVANPKTAPYGEAARETLERMGLWQTLAPRLVRGEDIGQTFQFVASGNADLGFVALSQVKGADRYHGSYWIVPDTFHQPVEQQAVLLEKGRNNPAARAFMAFLKGKAARAMIENFGYGVPLGVEKQ